LLLRYIAVISGSNYSTAGELNASISDYLDRRYRTSMVG